MKVQIPALSLLAALAVTSPAAVQAERPRTGYQWVDPGMGNVVEPAALDYNLIYLNGCFGDGDCDITYGYNDSRSNRSSIAEGTLSKFQYGQIAWDAVVDCVTKTYEPFDVVITDEDPGDVPHFEAMVAGEPHEVGMSSGVGGVSPFSCGIIDNAITYSFANIYGDDIESICWTVAQETAHAFGLDHQAMCADPMTYDYECGARKWFQNEDSRCGEYESNPRSCECGGATQNSFERITEVFGEGTIETPTVEITSPADGDTLEEGFVVKAELDGVTVPMRAVGLYVNSVLIDEKTRAPYSFIVPRSLSDGRMHIEVRAISVYGKAAAAELDVIQGAPCEGSSDCADDEACVDGRCVVGPGVDGGLGEECDEHDECVSSLCGESDDGKFCAEPCELGAGGCPDGFGCLDTGDMGVCWKGYDDGSGGCRASGRGGMASLGVGLALAMLMLLRRRRA